jgi:response regulator RpfG family c-di-GMP phosphodiesterase
MDYAVLFVDDDARILSAIERNLKKAYRLGTAGSGDEALKAIATDAYAVVVSDLSMPGMNGIELLKKVKQLRPDTIRILLTGHADVDAAIAAVNEGSIFRFLAKPCPQEVLTRTLDAAFEQYRLVTAERELLHQTLMGTVAALVGVLATVQPLALGRTARIARYVRQLAAELKVSDRWEIEVAAMLSQIGCIALNPEVLKKYYAGETLSNAERSDLLSQSLIGCGLVRRIPRLHTVAQIVEHQHDSFSRAADLSPEAQIVVLGAQLLRVAIDFDRLIGIPLETEAALAVMRRNESEYNAEVLAALERIDRTTQPEAEHRDYPFAALLQQLRGQRMAQPVGCDTGD